MKKEQVLVLGASPNPVRYSYIATRMLTDYGHQVYPYGLREGRIEDIDIQTDWPEDIELDTVTLYIGPARQEAYFERIAALQPSRVIFNPGTETPAFYAYLKERNIAFTEACTLVLLRTGQY